MSEGKGRDLKDNAKIMQPERRNDLCSNKYNWNFEVVVVSHLI